MFEIYRPVNFRCISASTLLNQMNGSSAGLNELKDAGEPFDSRVYWRRVGGWWKGWAVNQILMEIAILKSLIYIPGCMF